jgi:hypothetical protein
LACRVIFWRQSPLIVRFWTFDGISSRPRPTDRFSLRLSNLSEITGPDALRMCIGFVPLIDLYGIYAVLGRGFLARNIRFALPPNSYVNRSLARTFASMLLQRSCDPALFPFHHNGITLSAGQIERQGDNAVVFAPRLLNGAQTISTFGDFWERKGPRLKASGGELQIDHLLVSCRIITGGTIDEITEITVSNNRQNPVKPWQLHANDQIQLQLEDWFKGLKIPYQRQDRAYAKIPPEEWERMDLKERKAIELVKLARTYLAAEGEITKLTHIQNVFENEQDCKDVFGEHRLHTDVRRVVLCYKSQFHIRRITDEIADRGKDKYAFVHRTKEIIGGLVCQALLNDGRIDDIAEEFGRDLTLRLEFRMKLRELATTRVKPLLKYLLENEEYASKVEEGNYSFIRTSAAFKKAMTYARNEYGWQRVLLRG